VRRRRSRKRILVGKSVRGEKRTIPLLFWNGLKKSTSPSDLGKGNGPRSGILAIRTAGAAGEPGNLRF